MNRLSCLILSLLSLGVGNSAQAAPGVQIPQNLQVPSGQTLLFSVVGQGSQIYRCQATGATQYEWMLKAPDAVLLNDRGQPVGKHYAGPTWEANDQSKVAAQVKGKASAPNQTAIPWLLLEVKSHEGSGQFSSVNWIQRLQTTGGKAPGQGCDRAHENTEVRVGYTADYHFYGAPAAKNSSIESYMEY